MDRPNISHQPRRSRQVRDRPAFQARFEQALRQLPLAEPDITVVAGKLADKFAHVRSNSLLNSSALFDIRGKVTSVCDHFAGDGLTLDNYLCAALRRPQLFIKSPATIITNIERVAAHFSRYDLMRRRYLHAAVKTPLLFVTNPDTVIANVETVIQHFAGDGLNLRQYLQAALKQPQLFYRKPATTIRQMNYLIDLHRAGLLTFPAQADASPDQPLRPLFELLLTRAFGTTPLAPPT